MSTPASQSRSSKRLLITAGPTQEPIDAVRFIGNRSSGRLGVALAAHAAMHGWRTTLLLGPTANPPPFPPFPPVPSPAAASTSSDSRVEVVRFRTTAELGALLDEHFPSCDVLVMAAAVADYRPVIKEGYKEGKIRRTDQKLVLELEPTPDLLAACGKRKRADQLVVGFALEPRERLIESATSKLQRKHLDLVVANPLETMDSDSIEAVVLGADGSRTETPGTIKKEAFAGWLLDRVEATLNGRADAGV